MKQGSLSGDREAVEHHIVSSKLPWSAAVLDSDSSVRTKARVLASTLAFAPRRVGLLRPVQCSERHVPTSIATSYALLARALLHRLACRWCGRAPGTM